MYPPNPPQTFENQFSTPPLGFVRVGGRYRLGKLLGTGGSGSVYLGKDTRTGFDVAVKIGHACDMASRLTHEYNVYETVGGSVGISEVFWYGKEGLYEVMVLDYLGTSLGDLIDQLQIDERYVFSYATEMLSAVWSLHSQDYIHCDIKPGNFMIGDHKHRPTVFLIDFGLAQLFRDPTTNLHHPFTTDHPIIGTLPFSSVNSQQGYAQSRRDDLESLAYTIIYLALGDLPWTGNTVEINEEAVFHKKPSITVEELCDGLPAPFCNFVTYIRSLGFDEEPDYQYLHSILLQCSEIKTNSRIKASPPFKGPLDTPTIFTGRVLRSTTRMIAESPQRIHTTPSRVKRARRKK